VVEAGEDPDSIKAKLAALVDAAEPETPAARAPAVEPFKPFPTDALPEPARSFVRTCANAKHYAMCTDLDADFKRAAALDRGAEKSAEEAQGKTQKSAEGHKCQDLAGECANAESSESKTQTDKGGQTPVLAGRTGKWAIQNANAPRNPRRIRLFPVKATHFPTQPTRRSPRRPQP